MMFRKTKHIAAMLVMIAVLSALALSGCMPATTGGDAGSAEGGGTSSGLMTILPLILIIAVFYFVLIRPQNKKNKQVNEMRSNVKRGDWVTTIGGFKGRVVRVKDDLVTIEVGSDKTKLDIMKWGISKIDESAPERKSSRIKDEDEDERVEEEQPKRKPRKLAPAAKKEAEAEDTEAEEILEEVSEDEEDKTK